MNKVFNLLIFTLASLLATTDVHGMSYISGMLKSACSMFLPKQSFPALEHGTIHDDDALSNLFESYDVCHSDNPLSIFDEERLATLFGTMADRERRYRDGYQAFYHGGAFQFYEYLLVNKLLMARKIGYKPKDFEFLRAPGTRKKIDDIKLSDYMERSHKHYFDDSADVREQLLSVSYSPLAGRYGESARFFFVNNAAVGYSHNQRISELVRAFGFKAKLLLSNFADKSRAHFGVMLQIFIKKSMVDKLVYDSRPFGLFSGPVPKDVSFEKLRSGQARILLRPQFFDHPSDNVKIFVYTLANEKEQRELCEVAQDYVDSLKHRFFYWVYSKRDVERSAFQPF